MLSLEAIRLSNRVWSHFVACSKTGERYCPNALIPPPLLSKRNRVYALVLTTAIVCPHLNFLSPAHAACSQQIAPNPNPTGNTINASGCNGLNPYTNSGTLAINLGSTVVNENGATLDNRGTLINNGALQNYGVLSNGFMGGNLTNNAGGAITNYAGANLGNLGSLNNLGTIENHGEMGNMTSFSNSGLFHVTSTGTLTGSGGYTQTAGTTIIDGTVRQNAGFNIAGGVLQGSGIMRTDSFVTLNGGTLSPGNSAGTLSIDGNYTQTALSTFAVEIGGNLAGAEYDVLSVSGAASLGGTLSLSFLDLGGGIFSPQAGDSFEIIQASTITGRFDTLLLASPGANLDWRISYSNTVVRLSVTAAIPEPETYAMLLAGLWLLGFAVRRKKRS